MAMWVGVVTYELSPGKKAKATTVWQEYVRPFLTQQKDCVGALWMVAQDGDRAMSIDFWDNQLAASAFETSGLFNKLVAHFDKVLAEPPARTEFQADDAFAFSSEEPKSKGVDLKLMETMTISFKSKKAKG